MENPDLREQDHRNPAAFALADVGPQLLENGFDITPRNISARRAGKDQFECALVSPFHGRDGTAVRYQAERAAGMARATIRGAREGALTMLLFHWATCTSLSRLAKGALMTVIVNIRQAKSQLSKLLARAQAGEDVIIARAGKPWARLVPIRDRDHAPRRPGIATGAVTDAFFEPLADRDLDAWT